MQSFWSLINLWSDHGNLLELNFRFTIEKVVELFQEIHLKRSTEDSLKGKLSLGIFWAQLSTFEASASSFCSMWFESMTSRLYFHTSLMWHRKFICFHQHNWVLSLLLILGHGFCLLSRYYVCKTKINFLQHDFSLLRPAHDFIVVHSRPRSQIGALRELIVQETSDLIHQTGLLDKARKD